MSVDTLREWLASELRASGMPGDEARAAASVVVNGSGANPVTVATAVCAARAITALPEGSRWWRDTDIAHAVGKLNEGNPDYVFSIVAERLAAPAPDRWDPNWPPSKVAHALLPDHPCAGQTFVVGNGEGARATVEVIERDGRLEAVITSAQPPLGDLWPEALERARTLLSSR